MSLKWSYYLNSEKTHSTLFSSNIIDISSSLQQKNRTSK